MKLALGWAPTTPAADMPDHVEQPVIDKRHAHLLDLQKRISAERVRNMVGQRHDVLVESMNGSREETVVKGRTRNYKVANVPGSECLIREEVSVRVMDVRGYTLQCDPIDATGGIQYER